MSGTSKFELADEEILTYDITDEQLETATSLRSEQAGVYTLGSCTGYYSCPPQLT